MLGVFQREVKKQGQPYDNCIDTSRRIHNFDINVYEEIYPESYYSVQVCAKAIYNYGLFLTSCRRSIIYEGTSRED